jgi:enamine deaminase RidA (YjgF/YER057c/UK114 family)
MTSVLTALQPEGWPTPRGYANGMMGRGRVVLVGGQIGWDSAGRFRDGLVAQTRQALENILAVLRAAGGGAEHIGRLTWYVVDMAEYRACLKELGPAYRAAMGRHYPAMALVQVVALVEPAARVEIEATALIPD